MLNIMASNTSMAGMVSGRPRQWIQNPRGKSEDDPRLKAWEA